MHIIHVINLFPNLGYLVCLQFFSITKDIFLNEYQSVNACDHVSFILKNSSKQLNKCWIPMLIDSFLQP